MKKTYNHEDGNSKFLFQLAAVLSIISLIIFFSVKVYKSLFPLDPEGVVRAYVTALSEDDCHRAFSMISSYIKDYDSNYGSFGEFKKNVCGPVHGKYSSINVKSIDQEVKTSDLATVHLRLILKPSAFPGIIDRETFFDLRREGKRWCIDGPSLEF